MTISLGLHALQSLPSSNINRDDTGAPKTAMMGGVERARISSQSLKRAMRLYIENNHDIPETWRSRSTGDLIAKELIKLDDSFDEDSAKKRATDLLEGIGIKTDKKNPGKTSVLLFISDAQIKSLAQFALEHEKFTKKDLPNDVYKQLKSAFTDARGMMIALFGRMIAEAPEFTTDATSQVAHAISTHEIELESDYWTALDDLKPDTESGASNIGERQFDSFTAYRNANISLTELVNILGKEQAIEAIKYFVEAFVLALPTGSQNAFAATTVPDYVMLDMRTDGPVNLSPAFENAIKPTSDGYMQSSITALEDYENRVNQMKIDAPVETLVLDPAHGTTIDGEQVNNLPEMINHLGDKLNEVL